MFTFLLRQLYSICFFYAITNSINTRHAGPSQDGTQASKTTNLNKRWFYRFHKCISFSQAGSFLIEISKFIFEEHKALKLTKFAN